MIEESKNETEGKVTGMGGVFFHAQDPDRLKQWYHSNLGIEVNEWGATFQVRNAHVPEELNYQQWTPFPASTQYFEPSRKPFMINYRVQNLTHLIDKLRKNGVTILDDIEVFEYGKFIHILDEEGNKIELWEPVDAVFTDLEDKKTN